MQTISRCIVRSGTVWFMVEQMKWYSQWISWKIAIEHTTVVWIKIYSLEWPMPWTFFSQQSKVIHLISFHNGKGLNLHFMTLKWWNACNKSHNNAPKWIHWSRQFMILLGKFPQNKWLSKCAWIMHKVRKWETGKLYLTMITIYIYHFTNQKLMNRIWYKILHFINESTAKNWTEK